MASEPSGTVPPPGPERQRVVRHADVALRSIGQPNSVVSEFDFWNDRYEGRRLFSEVLGTFFLVLVAVGGGMVNARFGGQAVPYGARVVAPALMVMAIIAATIGDQCQPRFRRGHGVVASPEGQR